MARRASAKDPARIAVRVCIAGALFFLALIQPGALAAEPSLRSALAQLGDKFNVAVMYSSTAVPEEWTSAVDLPLDDTLERSLAALLAPHGLSAVASGDLWFIVARKPAPAQLTALLIVRDADTHERIVGMQLSSANPALQLTALAAGAYQGIAVAGKYALEFSAPGYPSQTLHIELAQHAKVLPMEIAPSAEVAFDRLVVSTSRYGVIKAPSIATSLSSEALDVMPKAGEDPLRLVRRLPGAASGGLSARVHLRGGGEDETALLLDGLTLTDPFHLRDYQSVFSAIDRRLLADVDVYTGAFPATFGDSLSGVIEMHTIEPTTFEHEVSASFLHLSAFSSGTFANANGDYLLSLRRGNLGWLLDQINGSFGEPDYRDFFARVRFADDNDFNFSLNVHRAVDNVSVIPEALPEERVEAFSDTRNTHVWATLQKEWNANLFAQTILSYSALDNDRRGASNDTEDVIGRVVDQRRRQTVMLQQDWTWRASATSQWRFGGRLSDTSARYRYASTRQFFDRAAELAGDDSLLERAVDADFAGHELGAYLSMRFVPLRRFVAEAGLRWDRQTYTGDSPQWSPRVNLLFNQTTQRRFRLSLGRFHQSQAIHALQVEDGLTRFNRAQRADQWVVGFEQDLFEQFQVRLELYTKHLTRPAPRFENLFDPLVVLPELAADRVRIDPASARVRGAELTLRSTGQRPLSWWFSYTRSQATDRIDGRDVPRSWDQRDAVSGGVAWRSDKWEASIAGLWRSGWPTTQAVLDSDGRLRPAPRNADRLGGFSTIDLHIARHFQVGRSRVTLTADIINALDRTNPCCVGYDVDEVVVREVDHWLPIIPSLGFRVQF